MRKRRHHHHRHHALDVQPLGFRVVHPATKDASTSLRGRHHRRSHRQKLLIAGAPTCTTGSLRPTVLALGDVARLGPVVRHNATTAASTGSGMKNHPHIGRSPILDTKWRGKCIGTPSYRPKGQRMVVVFVPPIERAHSRGRGLMNAACRALWTSRSAQCHYGS